MNSESSYQIEGERLILSTGASVAFDYPIEKVVEFEAVLAVLLRVPPSSKRSDNILGVNREGEVIWRIPHVETVHAPTPYRRMVRIGDLLATGNVEGLEIDIDPTTGEMVRRTFRKF